jgi:hypothetical protein
MPQISVRLAQITNLVIILAVLVLAIFIGFNARRKGYPMRDAIFWGLGSFFLFPIGPIVYFYFSRRKKTAQAV